MPEDGLETRRSQLDCGYQELDMQEGDELNRLVARCEETA